MRWPGKCCSTDEHRAARLFQLCDPGRRSARGAFLLYKLTSSDDEHRERIENFPWPRNPDGSLMETTLSEPAIEGIANRVYNDLWETEVSEDEEDMMIAILRCNNDADLVGLIRKYGVRSSPYALNAHGDADLFGAVQIALNTEEHHVLNVALGQKGITIPL